MAEYSTTARGGFLFKGGLSEIVIYMVRSIAFGILMIFSLIILVVKSRWLCTATFSRCSLLPVASSLRNATFKRYAARLLVLGYKQDGLRASFCPSLFSSIKFYRHESISFLSDTCCGRPISSPKTYRRTIDHTA